MIICDKCTFLENRRRAPGRRYWSFEPRSGPNPPYRHGFEKYIFVRNSERIVRLFICLFLNELCLCAAFKTDINTYNGYLVFEIP